MPALYSAAIRAAMLLDMPGLPPGRCGEIGDVALPAPFSNGLVEVGGGGGRDCFAAPLVKGCPDPPADDEGEGGSASIGRLAMLSTALLEVPPWEARCWRTPPFCSSCSCSSSCFSISLTRCVTGTTFALRSAYV